MYVALRLVGTGPAKIPYEAILLRVIFALSEPEDLVAGFPEADCRFQAFGNLTAKHVLLTVAA